MNSTTECLKTESPDVSSWQKRERHPLQRNNSVRILIVDDDPESILPLQRSLTNYGCNVTIVRDGYTAARVLAHDTQFTLIFLDWNLPGIEGGETIQMTEKSIAEDAASKRFWRNKSVPVVTYSAEDVEKIHVPQASHFSFVDHWPKSMGFVQLDFHVREILHYLGDERH